MASPKAKIVSNYVSLEEAGIALTRATRAEMADMVGVDEAAQLAGVSKPQLLRMATQQPPTVVCLPGPGGRVFPRWQFAPNIWPTVQQLPGMMRAGGAEVLSWLETPHGALEGLTPRAAIEQGETDGAMLELAKWWDT